VADLLEEEADLTVVGQASTVSEALARIPALRPDVVVLDVRLPDGNGVELCRELKSSLPELNCLMLTSYTDEQAMLEAILAGAGGYVIKDIKGMEFELFGADAQRATGRPVLVSQAPSWAKTGTSWTACSVRLRRQAIRSSANQRANHVIARAMVFAQCLVSCG
jgi:DNA-binding NarL/FixJ family response regulator